MGIPSLTQDFVNLRSPSRDQTRLVVFTQGSDIMSLDGRPVITENVVVASDGTILFAVNPAKGRTQVMEVGGERVLYVGALVVDQAGWDNVIERSVVPSVAANWA